MQPDSASLPRSVPTVTHPSGKWTNSLSAQAVRGASNAGIAGISWRRLQPALELPAVSRLEDKSDTCLRWLSEIQSQQAFTGLSGTILMFKMCPHLDGSIQIP